MPCDSRVIGTRFVSQENLARALNQVGAKILDSSKNQITAVIKGQEVVFFRQQGTDAFSTTDYIEDDAYSALNRAYSEQGIRAWAKRTGFSLTRTDGNRFEFVKRR